MTRTDSSLRRIFVDDDLTSGQVVKLDRAQSNHLLTVLRLKADDPVLVFNGRHGEYRARIEPQGRKSAILTVDSLTRTQTPLPKLHLLFAPLKQARLEYAIQKAVEMGVGVLQPVITQHTQMTRLKTEKTRSYVIEAAEQCGSLSLPEIRPIAPLSDVLAQTSTDRGLVFCDEQAPLSDPLAALRALHGRPVSVLIGPEGGFSDAEREMIVSRGNVVPIALGPRILRADTAAVAALALVQVVVGDWGK